MTTGSPSTKPAPQHPRVRNLAVSVYDLISSTDEQLELFASPTHAVSEAMDKINDKWGEFVITPALMLGIGWHYLRPNCVRRREGIRGNLFRLKSHPIPYPDFDSCKYI